MAARPGAGRPRREFTAEERKQIEALAGYGLTQPQIAIVMAADEKTIRRHARAELAAGGLKATVAVAQSLHKRALGGDTIACIYWLKCRAPERWNDRQVIEIANRAGRPLKVEYSWAEPPPPPPSKG